MRYLLFFWSCFSVCQSACAGIEEYFKRAENKSDEHKIRNIDFIYMINLDQRPEKFIECCKQLHLHGIYPYRFSAVNGWELSLEAINAVGLSFSTHMEPGIDATSYLDNSFSPHHDITSQYGQTYFARYMTRGAIGIVLSHLSVLQDAYDSGYDTIWVMEDDIEIKKDPHLLSDLISLLDGQVGKGNWDILFTDRDSRNPDGEYIPSYGMAKRPDFHPSQLDQYYVRQEISADFRALGSRFGAYSMILKRSGIEKILNFLKEHKVFLPYDLEYYLPVGMKIYTVLEDVVSNQPHALTDNGAPHYLSKFSLPH